jgi:5-methylcytosine-specific restriction endonuclease McrA
MARRTLTVPGMTGRVEHPTVPGVDLVARLRTAILPLAALRTIRKELFRCGRASPLRRRLVRVTVRAPEEVAEHFASLLRRVRRMHRYLLDDGQCVVWMLIRFAAEWAKPELEALHRQYAIFERDGWLCGSPRCTARGHLEEHHLTFRSQGGSDAAANRSTRCVGCHRHVIHAGTMRVKGEAPGDMVQVLGVGEWKEAYRNEIRIPLPDWA